MIKKITPKSGFLSFPQEWEPNIRGKFFKYFLENLNHKVDKKRLIHETKQILQEIYTYCYNAGGSKELQKK